MKVTGEAEKNIDTAVIEEGRRRCAMPKTQAVESVCELMKDGTKLKPTPRVAV